MLGKNFDVLGDPSSDPKAAVQWLAEQRRRPIRAPHKIVEYGELVITSPLLKALADDELYALLEQVAIAAVEVAHFDLAESCIARLASRFPNSHRVIALQGMLLEGCGNPSGALQLYDAALEKDSTALTISRRRIACLKTLHPEKVVEALNKHVDTFYNDPEAWAELAEVYANQGCYAQSAFALEEVLLQQPQNSFFHLKYAETLYTSGDVAKAYKAYLRVLEMCQSDAAAVSEQGGPWLRALWGTKMTTAALIANPTLIKMGRDAPAEDAIDAGKVKKIDELVTSLLLNKVYTPRTVEGKHLRDTARAVLAA